MKKTKIVYREKYIFPLPGTTIKGRREVIFLNILGLVALFSCSIVGMLVIGSERAPTWTKVIVLAILVLGTLILVDSQVYFVRPKLRSSLPIIIYDKGIHMPVTLFERYLRGRKPFISIGDIQSIEIGKPKEWNVGDSLELLVVTKDKKAYRSSAKEKSKILEIAEIISRKWPHIPLVGVYDRGS